MNTKKYNIEVCMYRHEDKVEFSPRGVPYYCNKCETSTKAKRPKVREITSLSK